MFKENKITLEQKLLWAEKYNLWRYVDYRDSFIIERLREKRRRIKETYLCENFFYYKQYKIMRRLYGPKHKLP